MKIQIWKWQSWCCKCANRYVVCRRQTRSCSSWPQQSRQNVWFAFFASFICWNFISSHCLYLRLVSKAISRQHRQMARLHKYVSQRHEMMEVIPVEDEYNPGLNWVELGLSRGYPGRLSVVAPGVQLRAATCQKCLIFQEYQAGMCKIVLMRRIHVHESRSREYEWLEGTGNVQSIPLHFYDQCWWLLRCGELFWGLVNDQHLSVGLKKWYMWKAWRSGGWCNIQFGLCPNR